MPHHLDYLAVIEAESRRFLDCLAAADAQAAVPSCPEWTASDLLWHLTEVQHFWGSIVAGRLHDPEQVQRFDRPGDHASLLRSYETASGTLVGALRGAAPEEPVWTWSDDHSVGFVLRRQAHEALIHRVDAELVAGEVTDADGALAADGIDEILRVMLADMPDWGTFEPDGRRLRLEAGDGQGAWTLGMGRFRGTSPSSGNTYDLDAAALVDGDGEADTVVRGDAWLLDRWLWGRAEEGPPSVEGDEELARRLRAALAEATQ